LTIVGGNVLQYSNGDNSTHLVALEASDCSRSPFLKTNWMEKGKGPFSKMGSSGRWRRPADRFVSIYFQTEKEELEMK
jgi:hypothetical protein